jgi:hypothetical protein
VRQSSFCLLEREAHEILVAHLLVVRPIT